MKIRLQLTSATPVTIVAWWSTIPVGMTPPPALPSSACTVLTGAAQAFSIMECSNFLSTQQCLSMYAKASGRRRFGSPWLQHPMDENVGVAKQFLPGFMRISFKKMSNSQPLSVLGVCLTWSECVRDHVGYNSGTVLVYS